MCYRGWVVKIATFLSTTESIASDFSPVIINISTKALLDTNFGLRFNENTSFLEFEFSLRVQFKYAIL